MGKESRIWMAVAFTFIAASIVLGIFLIIEKNEGEFDTEAFLSRNKDAILAAFPSNFHSEQEKEALQEAYMRATTGPEKTYPVSDDSFRARFCPATQCNNGTESTELRRRRRAQRSLSALEPKKTEINSFKNQAEPLIAKTVYEACCEATFTLISPEDSVNMQGETVPLVTFSDKKQWFPSEKCSQAPDCGFCTCEQQTTLGHAVVLVNTREIKLDWVILPGCCKCVNK